MHFLCAFQAVGLPRAAFFHEWLLKQTIQANHEFEMAHRRQDGEHILHNHADIPGSTRAGFHVGRITVFRVKADIGQHEWSVDERVSIPRGHCAGLAPRQSQDVGFALLASSSS